MYKRSKAKKQNHGLEINVHSDVIVKELGLVQISDSGELEKAVEDVVARHPNETERFRAGDEKLMGFFVGQVMKLTRGKANPRIGKRAVEEKAVVITLILPQPFH